MRNDGRLRRLESVLGTEDKYLPYREHAVAVADFIDTGDPTSLIDLAAYNHVTSKLLRDIDKVYSEFNV